VTKKEIVKVISEEFDEPQVKVKDIVQKTFDLIVEALKKEGRIELRNFGVFEVKRRKKRRARNPRTNQPVEVDAKNVVTFQPGKFMEEEVRNAEKVIEPKRKPTRASKPTGTKPPASTETPHPTPVGNDHDDREEDAVPVGAAVGGGGLADDDLTQSPDLPHKPR
jgi:nucleoid DNA-binding protein